MATTIQERLQYLCELTGLSPEKLSLTAGLSKRYVRNILLDPKRTSVSSIGSEKLSYVTRVSRSWIVSGVGHPEAKDVPELPPETGKPTPLENMREWVTFARRALEIDPKLDWAVMGVGERPSGTAREELTAYALLAEAERFKSSCTYEERKRLDQKARRFRKQYFQSPARTTQPQRQSVPPGKA